jgi:glycosyltransferase involved in cell wall biosynthesis
MAASTSGQRDPRGSALLTNFGRGTGTVRRIAFAGTRRLTREAAKDHEPRPRGAGARGGERITMLLENNPYPQDIRVRAEAESLVAAGHQVEVIAPRASGQPARECVDGVAVRRFGGIEAGSQGVRAMLLEFMVAAIALHLAAVRALARGSTVLHIHNPPDILFLAGAMFRIARRRVVFDHHDLFPELVAAQFGAGGLVGLARLSEGLTFAVADRVLAANESHAELAVSRGGKSAEQVTVVRNGPPASWLSMPLRLRDGPLSPVRLAYVGSIAAQDGVEGMAEILACLRDRSPPVDSRLTVIGSGYALAIVESALARHGVSDAVTVTGWVSPEQVPLLLQDADICVDPAPSTPLNERSTMMKVAEYLALGKPVVAYDLLETRRTVGGAALLAPAGDSRAFAERIATLAEDPALRTKLAHQARDRAAALTWETSESELLAVYAGLGRKRTGPNLDSRSGKDR